ncbi:ABC transporter ATP-binding protein [Hahella aquimaris]|uniref:ABC transporter ATP-binding protein n=1 Tax=Hahella sp. HNIBRBA332 TaxID=3015983 RepID=UPI00273B3EB9|nr:ABC transporter ATP-binding protein [Hahella sp. HNIBRBA332]WLQ13941.1 ABC transporter ATP-binding protein [Hahella sp. HNIBRBA332]
MKRDIKEGLSSYVAMSWRYDKHSVVLLTVLLFVLAFVQGIGVLALIPLLTLAGVDAGYELGSQWSWLGSKLELTEALIIFVAIIALHAVIKYFQQILAARLQTELAVSLRGRLTAKILAFPWLRFTQFRASHLAQVLNHEVDRASQISLLLTQLVSLGCVLSVYSAISCLTSPGLTLVALTCGGGIYGGARRLNRLSLQNGEKGKALRQTYFSAVSEHMQGMKVVKAFGQEKRAHVDLEVQAQSLGRTLLQFKKLSAMVALYYEILIAICLGGLCYFFITWVRLPAAEFIVLLFLFSRFAPILKDMSYRYQQILNILPSYIEVVAILNCDGKEALVDNNREAKLITVTRSIRLEGVCFNYPSTSGQDSLRDLSITLPVNSVTALLGPSGSGKTTTADILSGLLTPSAGQVLIDDTELTEQEIAQWSRSVSYVTQESFLFNKSVRENLLWVAPWCEEAELWEALRNASAESFVRELPQGMDTLIGERGDLLSGGEKQRLAIARALLRKPALLILDEVSSALDEVNEAVIIETIQALKKMTTVLVITHRQALLACADFVAHMEGVGDAQGLKSTSHELQGAL